MKNKQKYKRSGQKANNGGITIIGLLTVLAFRNKTVGQKLIDSKKILISMIGNGYFTNPFPSLATVAASIDALADAEKRMDGSRVATIARNARLKEMTFILQGLRSYVETVANGNPEIVASSGFEVRKAAVRVGLLDFPTGFTARNTAVAGQIKLRWNAVAKRIIYVIEYTTHPEGGAPVSRLSCTKKSVLVCDLNSDIRLYFRISTNSTEGNGGFGPWVSCRPN
ncbi:MAG: hypothetical protein IPP77_13625 [Bacteroidetes bacterium]|nr:hypothetical protein [Bacteroidota bacterium]